MVLRQRYSLSEASTDLAEPVTIQEAAQYLRISDPDDDVWLRTAIRGARSLVEKTTHRQLMTKTWDLTIDCFPAGAGTIEIPRPPLVSVDSVTYVTVSGDSTTMTLTTTTVYTDTASEPGRFAPAYNTTWPNTQARENAVTIQFTAGYGNAGKDVPDMLRQAVLMLVGHWYEQRETVVIGGTPQNVPFAFDALCQSYRFGGLH